MALNLKIPREVSLASTQLNCKFDDGGSFFNFSSVGVIQVFRADSYCRTFCYVKL
jgi:hypothetical protein